MTVKVSAQESVNNPDVVNGLDVRKVFIIIALGVFFWFLGIFEIRWVGVTGALSNDRTPFFYVLIVISTIPIIWFTPRMLGLARSYRMHCGAIMGAVASLLDGITMRWTHWYASDPQLLANSAATLLWAIGVAVAVGYIMFLDQSKQS